MLKLALFIIVLSAVMSSFALPAPWHGRSNTQGRLETQVSVRPSVMWDQAKAPPVNIRLVDLEGVKKLLASGTQTKPLLVNFWATWCDPCRDEFPDLVKVDQDYRAKGLDFIAISLDDAVDIKTAVPDFLRQMKATMPVFLLNVSDPEPVILAVDKDWGGALPATFLYDAHGKVVFKYYGRVKTPELRDAIEKVMNEKK